MSNLGLRVVSALVLTVSSLFLLGYSLYTRWILITLALVLGTWEFSEMVRKKLSPDLNRAFSWVAPLGTLLFFLFFPFQKETWLWLWISGFVCLFVLAGFRFITLENLAVWVALQVCALLFFTQWCKWIFSLTIPLKGFQGYTPLLLTLFCTVAADTGGYFTGKKWGKRKLAPHISPKKTIEGALGGLVFTVAIAAILGPLIADWNFWAASGFGFLIAFTSPMGDLLFSALKRYCGAKDSSSLIPGHGGILDRFDSIFFSAPIAVLYLKALT